VWLGSFFHEGYEGSQRKNFVTLHEYLFMIKIMQAIPDQAGALTTITISAKRHWNYPEKWIQIWLPLLTITPENILENETWVAVEGEKCIGYYSLKQDAESLWLDNLWVLPEFMGQGIGKGLFLHALERSRMLGATTLKIEADPNAQNFYEKMGAQKIGDHHTEVEGQPRMLPVLEINL
jgi:GNAT superfamily N-acetyltransferase